MSVVVIGLNHRTAPLDLLERTAVPAERLPKALLDLLLAPQRERGRGARPRATAPRSTPSSSASTAPTRTSATSSATSPAAARRSCADHLYSQLDDDAVDHLFAVAAGLDSAVLGESEILGQVRRRVARRPATRAPPASGSNLLFRHALEVGKRARTETAIGRSHGVGLVRRRRDGRPTASGSLDGRKVLVVGAGEMGEGMAVALAGRRRGRDAWWPTAP